MEALDAAVMLAGDLDSTWPVSGCLDGLLQRLSRHQHHLVDAPARDTLLHPDSVEGSCVLFVAASSCMGGHSPPPSPCAHTHTRTQDTEEESACPPPSHPRGYLVIWPVSTVRPVVDDCAWSDTDTTMQALVYAVAAVDLALKDHESASITVCHVKHTQLSHV
jgi:hypothetical protein